MASTCETCAFFSEAIHKAIQGEAIDDHVVRLVLSFDTNCATCKYILEHFARIAPNSPLRPTCPMRLDIFPQKRFFFRTGCGCWDHSAYHLELLPSPELAPTSVHHKTVDPEKIDIGSLKRWPEYCEKHHANCRSDSSQPAVTDIILIDAQDHCLVQFPVAPKYTTLSYVWGVLPDILETRISNFASLQLPNALLGPDVLGRLPRTIQDAIKVTREMGERYLWVDRLCIVQDDEANKAQQIASMASIYANSEFTIIAADGADANSGLQGISSPRTFPTLPVLELAPDCHMRPGPETEEARYFAPWHNRAWTFQERLLSRRSLIFFRGSVIWQCKTSIWAEGVAGEPDGIAPDDTWRTENKRPAHLAFDRHFMLQLETPSRPDFRHFEGLVRQYCRRKMTYQADGLRAFSGILDVLSRTYDGGFLYGMPKMFFDVAMLWEPLPGAKPRLVAPGSNALLFPSWSWAAFQGSVANNLSDDISRSPPAIDLSPVVKWYNVGSDGKASFVNLTQHLFRLVRQQGGVQGLDLSFFNTPTIDMSKVAVDKSVWDSFLHGSVMTAALHAQPAKEDPGPRLKISWEEEVAPFVEYHLTDSAGKILGWLKVPSTRRLTELPGDARCECVVISECRAHGARSKWLKQIYIPEWGMIEETRELDEFEFYNVLWVERRDGVAYRRGIGRVWKEGWHRQNFETRDIILG
ncbi:heterokaryon incompatibility protein-domain-containing protein [Apiosordaria backusii]|uniref:Heterokaryon incompatibility protein-domain-containing protein n=1 Tax=Apiosordaria backusii TaxID=314023 RepID=A0AA40AEL7_9PEZI|nr:heterokaryon incompatibility protein-domain-containing protein [Apiosordaria backusii]